MAAGVELVEWHAWRRCRIDAWKDPDPRSRFPLDDGLLIDALSRGVPGKRGMVLVGLRSDSYRWRRSGRALYLFGRAAHSSRQRRSARGASARGLSGTRFFILRNADFVPPPRCAFGVIKAQRAIYGKMTHAASIF